MAENTPSPLHRGPIYTPSRGRGTATGDELTLLEHYGIHGVLTDRQDAAKTGVATGMAALQQYLATGHKVIAGVNGETIWQQPDGDHTHDNHAVVVTAVDTGAGVVHLNDSGTPDGRDEQVPIATFVKAWDTGDDEMVVTQTADNPLASPAPGGPTPSAPSNTWLIAK